MDGKSWVLRAGEYLVNRASRYPPSHHCEERHQKWSAELPVILHAPDTRLAPRRAARMLWFAADTLRGAVVTRYTTGGRHARRDADGKAHDQVTRQELPPLLALPLLIALLVFLFYPGGSGSYLTHDVAFLLILVVLLLVSFIARGAVNRRGYQLSWALLVAATGQLLHDMAHRYGWGHPTLFTVIHWAGMAGWTVLIGLDVAVWIKAKAARARRRKART